MPLLGKEEIREQIGYPDNKACVIGSLRLRVPEKEMDHDVYYFQRVAGMAGYGLHHVFMLREITRLNEYMEVFGKAV